MSQRDLNERPRNQRREEAYHASGLVHAVRIQEHRPGTSACARHVLKRIKREQATSFILITHDVATSSELADRVALMYAGQVAEYADARRFFTEPAHPYSQMLMASVPRLYQAEAPQHIPGQPPDLLSPPQGCRYADRCPHRFARCAENPPPQRVGERHHVRCWLYGGHR